MIYFLINNTFHLQTVNAVIGDLARKKLGLIQVPYSLTPVVNDKRFEFITSLERLTYTKDYLADWPKKLLPGLRLNRKKISLAKKAIRPAKDDILFVFTEEELLNLILVKRFKNAGAKIYLIEDGIAAYVYYAINSDPISKRARLLMYIIRLIYGLKGYYPFVIKGYFCPRISDAYYSGICYFFPIQITRNFHVFQIKKNVAKKTLSANRNGLFLTQPIYTVYLTVEEYIFNLNTIISTIHSNFEKLYIKFHPDEVKSGLFLEIKKHIGPKENLVYLESTSNIEELISDIDINHVVSYNSSALMNLAFCGVEPVYMYHLYDFLQDNSTRELTKYLKTLNYNFPLSLEDVTPDFRSGIIDLVSSSVSINTLVENQIA